MAFTGKATYSSGMTLPDGAEDISDIVGIISPFTAPLLGALGDPLREATSSRHEWLEDVPGDWKERIRCGNYTQVFTATVEASVGGTAHTPDGSLSDELDFQKQERLREMICDLENSLINGGQPTNGQHTNPPVVRKMNGIRTLLKSNVTDASGKELDEEQITVMIRRIWETSDGNVDLIVVGGFQKRKINEFCARGGNPDKALDPIVTIYESDFGICRIVTTRWLPQDVALFLDSSRISVLPLAGRSFHFKPLASAGDYECGELIGEYTLELKNQAAHGLIRNLTTS